MEKPTVFILLHFLCSGSLRRPVPGVAQAVLLVFSVAERALAAYGVGPGKRDVLFQQHSQDLVVVPVGRQDDWSHVHGGGVLRVLNPLHQFLKKGWKYMDKKYCDQDQLYQAFLFIYSVFL